MKKTKSPKITLKVLYELLIRSYERFMYFRQTWKFTIFKNTSKQPKIKTYWRIEFQPQNDPKNATWKTDFRSGNQQKIMMVTKDLSSRRKLRKVFKKNFFEKIRFWVQKYEKNWKSKNDLKSPLRALNKELWAIYVFSSNLKVHDFQKHQRKQSKIKTLWRIEFQPQKDPKNATWKK